MNGQVIPFRPAEAELDEAWQAYDAARLRVEALYRDETSTSDQRRGAVIEAERLHAAFRRMLSRAEGR